MERKKQNKLNFLCFFLMKIDEDDTKIKKMWEEEENEKQLVVGDA